MKLSLSNKWFILYLLLFKGLISMSQCPTVNSTSQSFCDIESLLISDLQANDEGAGIAWFSTPESSTPLADNISLINGGVYYLDNAAGDCGNRIAVTVSILGPPTGLNFQGVCVEDPNDATIDDLEAFGNDINWYASSSSNTVLDLNTVLTDGTIYYADQSNPETGCRTSRLAVQVNIGIVPVPTGESVQEFCVGENLIPTVADLVASGENLWYASISSASPLDPSTPLQNGRSYYATIIDPPCESINRFEVQVFIVEQISAGTDGVLDICLDSNETFDLFLSLGGSPESGGTWLPALSSGTSIFDPNLDAAGVYTYTVLNSNDQCPDATASVTVSFEVPPSAGSDGSLSICADDTSTFNLFDSLGGIPDTSGTWSPALSSGTGVFDPSVDSEGTYTYTVLSQSSACADATASVTVSFEVPPSAGSDGSLSICEDDTSTFNLFDSLGGTPDTSGTWSPALNSGTGIFDPSVDSEGTYTYTVPESQCGPQDVAQVTVSILPNPDISDLAILINDVCEGEDVTVSLSNLSNLENGDYSISFEVTGSNNFDRSLTAAVINGETTFLLESELFPLAGLHTFNILSIISETSGCPATFDVELSELFELYESETPQINEEGGTFCVDEIPTLEDLTNRLINNNGTEWYDSETSTNPLPINTVLVNGVTYYASLKNENGCTSFIRLAVTIILDDCIEELIIPDGFSPNGDSVNDTFRIVNLEELYPNFKLTIYNRYGNKLYEGNINTPRWDGTTTSSSIGNGIVPNGVYFYILEFNDGIRDAKQGRIYLNR
jgi:gliding motility-associated-like protein